MSEDKTKSTGILEENKELNNEVLEEIRKSCAKEAKFSKITAFFVGGLFAVVLVAALILVPMAAYTINNANTLISNANDAVSGISSATGELGTMITSVTTTSDNMNTLLEDNAEDLSDAVTSLSEVDFDGLNTAISDLQTAVKPFATLFGGGR